MRTSILTRIVSLTILSLSVQLSIAQNNSFDLVIKNGKIVDGTGSPWFAADIAVKDGKIVAIGKLSESNARQTIDASGKIVAPGFIDMMGQPESSQ